MRQVTRAKMLQDILEEMKPFIKRVIINEQGQAIPEFYSAGQANAELRKFLNLGQQGREDGDVRRLSDAELINQLAEQAKDLGIEIDLSHLLRGQ